LSLGGEDDIQLTVVVDIGQSHVRQIADARDRVGGGEVRAVVDDAYGAREHDVEVPVAVEIGYRVAVVEGTREGLGGLITLIVDVGVASRAHEIGKDQIEVAVLVQVGRADRSGTIGGERLAGRAVEIRSVVETRVGGRGARSVVEPRNHDVEIAVVVVVNYQIA